MRGKETLTGFIRLQGAKQITSALSAYWTSASTRADMLNASSKPQPYSLYRPHKHHHHPAESQNQSLWSSVVQLIWLLLSILLCYVSKIQSMANIETLMDNLLIRKTLPVEVSASTVCRWWWRWRLPVKLSWNKAPVCFICVCARESMHFSVSNLSSESPARCGVELYMVQKTHPL